MTDDIGVFEFVQDTGSGEMGVRVVRTGEIFLQSELDELIEQLEDEDTVMMGDPLETTEWAVFTNTPSEE